MTFLSIDWILWSVAGLSLFWLIPNRWRDLTLAAVTLAFLAYADFRSALLLVGLTVFSYFTPALGLSKTVALVVAGLGSVSWLAYYKAVLSTSPVDAIRGAAIPLGISYYTFRILHYIIERYRGTLPRHRFGDYVAYLFFLPTILVGPIHRFHQFQRDRETRRWNSEDLSAGLERILYGYFLIVVVGNHFLSRVCAVWVGHLGPTLLPLMLYLEAVRGSLTLYSLFAGYSGVAIGCARLMGFRVMENFNLPFFKPNISEFWRSWHMSLTTWSRDYVYMTAVGATRNPIVGTLCSLTVIGVWHELSVRYVVWGLYHAAGIIAVGQTQKILRKRRLKRTWGPLVQPWVHALKVFATANYFFLGYVITSQDSFAATARAYWTILFSWWV